MLFDRGCCGYAAPGAAFAAFAALFGWLALVLGGAALLVIAVLLFTVVFGLLFQVAWFLLGGYAYERWYQRKRLEIRASDGVALCRPDSALRRRLARFEALHTRLLYAYGVVLACGVLICSIGLAAVVFPALQQPLY
jgi:hypothetical protein